MKPVVGVSLSPTLFSHCGRKIVEKIPPKKEKNDVQHNGPLGSPSAFGLVAVLAVKPHLRINSLDSEMALLAINNYIMTKLIKQWCFITTADKNGSL